MPPIVDRAQVRRIARAIREVGRSVGGERSGGAIVEAAARRVATEVESRTPVDEGDLIESGRVDRGLLAPGDEEPKPTRNGAARVYSLRAPYVGHLEYGTSKMSARPFLRPSLDVLEDEVPRRMSVEALHAVEREARRLEVRGR